MTTNEAIQNAIGSVAAALRGGQLLFPYEPTVRDQVAGTCRP